MSDCPHTKVRLLSAVVVKRSASSLWLIETAVCLGCAEEVSRESAVTPAKPWQNGRRRQVADPVLLCVPTAKAS